MKGELTFLSFTIIMLVLIIFTIQVEGYVPPDKDNIVLNLTIPYTAPDKNNVTLVLLEEEIVIDVCDITSSITITSNRDCSSQTFSISNNADVIFEGADLTANNITIESGSSIALDSNSNLIIT